MISMHYVPRCPRRFELDAILQRANQGPIRDGVPLHSMFRHVALQVYSTLSFRVFFFYLFIFGVDYHAQMHRRRFYSPSIRRFPFLFRRSSFLSVSLLHLCQRRRCDLVVQSSAYVSIVSPTSRIIQSKN